jgi:hypothetical protein
MQCSEIDQLREDLDTSKRRILQLEEMQKDDTQRMWILVEGRSRADGKPLLRDPLSGVVYTAETSSAWPTPVGRVASDGAIVPCSSFARFMQALHKMIIDGHLDEYEVPATSWQHLKKSTNTICPILYKVTRSIKEDS